MSNLVIRIQELLEEKNMNQKQLAKMSGVTEVTISRYMNGTRKPRIEIANKIAQVLGTTTDYLLGNSDIKNPYARDDQANKIEYINKLKKEYLQIAKELQDESIDIQDIKSFIDIIKRNRKR